MSHGSLGSNSDVQRGSLMKVTFCFNYQKGMVHRGYSPHVFSLPSVHQPHGFDSVSQFDPEKYGPVSQGQVQAPHYFYPHNNL